MTVLVCTGKQRPAATSRPERLAEEMTAHFYFYFIGSLIHGAWKGHKAQQTSVRLETCTESTSYLLHPNLPEPTGVPVAQSRVWIEDSVTHSVTLAPKHTYCLP